MNHRLAAVLSATGLAATALITGAPAARAADLPCTITGFSPTEVDIGITAGDRTFAVTTGGCTSPTWELTLGKVDDYMSASDPREIFQPKTNASARAYSAVATATNTDGRKTIRSWSSAFRLKRRTGWQSGTFDVGPEPAHRGGRVAIQGRLLRSDWDTGSYGGYAGKTAVLQFSPPHGTYRTVKYVGTDSVGWVRVTAPANRTGTWRLVFRGNTISSGAVSVRDGVRVTG